METNFPPQSIFPVESYLPLLVLGHQFSTRTDEGEGGREIYRVSVGPSPVDIHINIGVKEDEDDESKRDPSTRQLEPFGGLQSCQQSHFNHP